MRYKFFDPMLIKVVASPLRVLLNECRGWFETPVSQAGVCGQVCFQLKDRRRNYSRWTNGICYSWVKSTPSAELISIRIAVPMVKDYSLGWVKCRSSEEKLLNQNIDYDV